jgi:hypothetical protein
LVCGCVWPAVVFQGLRRCVSTMFFRDAWRQQNTMHHMIARRIRTAITCSTELNTAAIVPMEFLGTYPCTCRCMVDAKVMDCVFLLIQFSELNCQQDQAFSDLCLVSCGECSIRKPCSHSSKDGGFYSLWSLGISKEVVAAPPARRAVPGSIIFALSWFPRLLYLIHDLATLLFSCNLCGLRTLMTYGERDWYDLALLHVSDRFSLVIFSFVSPWITIVAR